MATLHIRRLLAIIPAASQAAFNAWWANNIDTGGAGSLTFRVPLNASGLVGDAVTHYLMCGAFTDAELKTIAARLCTLAGLSLPANWDTLTRAQKKAWFVGQIPTIQTNANIKLLLLDDNDGAWSDYLAAIAGVGLAIIRDDTLTPHG